MSKIRSIFVATLLNFTVAISAVLATPDTQTITGEKSMIELSKNGTRTINKGSAEFFTGDVQVEPLAQGKDPARVSAGKVTFEPCARSAWHTHPLGQMLIITDGCGLVQEWGKPAQIIRPGDVIWTPPGIKHWHGAYVNSKMTHIAIQESLNGKNVEWLEHVTDSEYMAGCACDSTLSNETN